MGRRKKKGARVVPKNLIFLRKSRKKENGRVWSQEDLAIALSDYLDQNILTYKAVAAWEKGTSQPSADKIEAYVKVFGCTHDFLFGKSTDPTRTEKEERNYRKQDWDKKFAERLIKRRNLFVENFDLFSCDSTLLALMNGEYELRAYIREEEPVNWSYGRILQHTATQDELDLLIDQISVAVDNACRSFIEWKNIHKPIYPKEPERYTEPNTASQKKGK